MTGSNAKAALADSLNALLADHFALYLKTKNFHWHVRGAQFRDLHLLFDERDVGPVRRLFLDLLRDALCAMADDDDRAIDTQGLE